MPVFARPTLISVSWVSPAACLEAGSSVRNLRITAATIRINVSRRPGKLRRKVMAATEEIIMADNRLIRLPNAVDTVVHGQAAVVNARAPMSEVMFHQLRAEEVPTLLHHMDQAVRKVVVVIRATHLRQEEDIQGALQTTGKALPPRSLINQPLNIRVILNSNINRINNRLTPVEAAIWVEAVEVLVLELHRLLTVVQVEAGLLLPVILVQVEVEDLCRLVIQVVAAVVVVVVGAEAVDQPCHQCHQA